MTHFQAAAAAAKASFDPTTIIMLVVLAALVIFMFRNSRKRKAAAENLKSEIVPGKEIMTNFGLFGTLLSIDEVTNVAEVETSPGHIVRVHRQTIAKVVEPSDSDAPRSVEEAMERANREAAAKDPELNVDHAIPAGEPEFGERISDNTDSTSSTKKTTD
jgi:preprotein translocase subunit YajC